MSNSRLVAGNILASLLAQRGSSSTLLNDHRSESDFQLIQEMVFGCCRWFHQLDFLLSQLLSKPVRQKDLDVKALLLVGLYQLREMRIPDHAAINETVEAVALLKKPWAKGLVNGVLRNYQRQAADLEGTLAKQDLAIRHSHPAWLVDAIDESWPGFGEKLLVANNFRPPMTLRINQRKVKRDEYLALLAESGIGAKAGDLCSTSTYLAEPRAVSELPGFDQGLVSVQDEASQLLPQFLHLAPGQRVLDACAAPGGKTSHILESEYSLAELIAIEKEPSRIGRIQENLERLELQARVLQADANEVDAWWDGEPFDRILLDAPCSATGVIRRHPDIKLLRQAEDIQSLARQQETLLHSLWPCLRPGGRLLYTTCSILKQENDELVRGFVDTVGDAKYEGVAADWGVECAYGRQLLPLEQNGPDGFFYSLLHKS